MAGCGKGGGMWEGRRDVGRAAGCGEVGTMFQTPPITGSRVESKRFKQTFAKQTFAKQTTTTHPLLLHVVGPIPRTHRTLFGPRPEYCSSNLHLRYLVAHSPLSLLTLVAHSRSLFTNIAPQPTPLSSRILGSHPSDTQNNIWAPSLILF